MTRNVLINVVPMVIKPKPNIEITIQIKEDVPKIYNTKKTSTYEAIKKGDGGKFKDTRSKSASACLPNT